MTHKTNGSLPHHHRADCDGDLPALHHALQRLPSGLYVLTASHDQTRSGTLVRWVQPCGIEPPQIMLSLRTGVAIEPLIRDSRRFAVCQIAADDRFLRRKFAQNPDHDEDPFVSMPLLDGPWLAPIPAKAMAYMDCELVRHVDIDSDCGIYIGRIRAAGTIHEGAPAVVYDSEGWPVDEG